MQDTFFYYAVLGAKSYRVLPIPDPRMMGVMKILIGIFACAMLCAQTEPLPPAPTDVKPGSITYDEIPILIRFLICHLRSMAKMSGWPTWTSLRQAPPTAGLSSSSTV
jgi:hypothetical protein